jgi:transcriptional regulator with XRE-family HTH domain
MNKSSLNEARVSIGEIVFKKRNEMKLTQEDVSNASGISKNTLGRIEQGKFSPGTDLLLSIFKILNIQLKIDKEIIT